MTGTAPQTGEGSAWRLSDHSSEITVGGDLSGQAAVGDNIVQMRVEPGGNVVLPAPGPPRVLPRPPPVLALGRRPRLFLDREAETSAGRAAAIDGSIVEFSGPNGAGKSTLLRQLAHQLAQEAARPAHAAVLLVDVASRPLDDVLQEVFGLLFETDRPYLPVGGALRVHLQAVRFIALVDDADAADAELQRLLDALPNSGVVLASTRQHQLADLQVLPLRGLPAEDARELVLAAADRNGRPDDAVVDRLTAELAGQPGPLAEASAAVVLAGAPLESVVVSTDPRAAAVEALPAPVRRLLRLLVAVPGLALSAAELSEIVASPVGEQLEALVEAGLLETTSRGHPPHYRAGRSLTDLTHARWNLGAEQRELIDFFIRRTLPRAAPLSPEEAAAARLLVLSADDSRLAREVLDLGRAAEPVLAASGRWGSWSEVLTAMLQAARTLGDRPAEAFVLHQLGTRALCLGAAGEAVTRLNEALQLREALGDEQGVRVTAANLEHVRLTSGDTSSDTPSSGPQPGLPWTGLFAPVAAALITVLLGVWGVLLLLPAEEPGRVGLTVDPAKLVFGSQPLQQSSAPQQVTVTNDGGSAAGPPELTSTGTHPGDFVVDGEDCSASLPPGRSCALIVVFQPTGTGHRQALLEIGLSGQEPVPVELTGDGASDEPPAPRIDESDPRIDEPDPERSAADVVPRSLAFGPVPEGTRSREQAVTVSSVGTDDLPLRAAALGGAHPADFEITDQSCTGELAPGDACRLTVVFAPTAVGERAATVTLAPDVRISLTGVGTAPADTEPPEITVSDVSVGTLSAAEDVEYEVSALDEVDGSVPVVCDPESGSAFPVGVTEVTCRATDDSGNEAEATFTVTVTEGQVE